MHKFDWKIKFVPNLFLIRKACIVSQECIVLLYLWCMIPGYLIEFLSIYECFAEPYLFKTKVKNWLLTESKAFSMSTVTNIPFNFRTLVICKTSDYLIIWNTWRKNIPDSTPFSINLLSLSFFRIIL